MFARKRCFFGILTAVFALTFLFSVTPSFSKPPKYRGYKGCIGCHKQQYESWKEGSMNYNAFKALLPRQRAEAKKEAGLDPNKDYSVEAECLACHATGYGEPSGFKNRRETPGLAGITCEFCHGPGEKYWKKMAKDRNFYQQIDLMDKGLTVPDQSTCDKCHREGCPFGSDEVDFDSEAAHDNFPLKGEH